MIATRSSIVGLAFHAAACWLAVAPVAAQMVHLPAVMPPSEAYPATAASAASPEYPSATSEFGRGTVPFSVWENRDSPLAIRIASRPGSPAELPLSKALPLADPDRPPDARDGVFQKLIFTYEWLLKGEDPALGNRDLELKTVLALPIPSRRWPLLITPGFAVHYLEGPTTPDLPPRVYDAYTQFRSLGKINPRLGAEMAVTLGEFGDFEQSTDEAFRVTGHAGVMWEWRPTVKILLGAAYIDTYDIDVIPIGGLIWTPHDDLKVEAVFPTPKVARRIYWRGAYTDTVQDWLYVAGEWGNDTWAIRRAAGFNDEVNYRDWRVLLGLERKAIGRMDYRLEVGYIFSRKLHYESATADVDLGDTVMLRAGMTF